mgnify:CR=1 FL=1|jgi:hypothetical protein
MQESLFIAAMLVLLAITGVEPGHAQTAKLCKMSTLGQLLAPC